jgi:hypothetical protein
MKKSSLVQKQKKLSNGIEKLKEQLSKLNHKRIIECGTLMSKRGLDQLDDTILKKSLDKLSEEIKNNVNFR